MGSEASSEPYLGFILERARWTTDKTEGRNETEPEQWTGQG